jgi:hypothetical protein
MGIPGDRDRLSMKIIRDVEGSAHTRSITSLHHDAMMHPWPPEVAVPVLPDPPRRRAIRAASPDATLTECLQAAFAAAEAAMTPQQRAKAAQRVLVVAANSEVQERGLLKHARIARSINAALRERGADELTARLGAEVGMLAFTIAVERWMEADNDEPFPVHAAAALSDLQVRAAELDSQSRLSA